MPNVPLQYITANSASNNSQINVVKTPEIQTYCMTQDVTHQFDTITSPLSANGNEVFEISGPNDMLAVRISQTLVERNYANSHAFGPFGWSLLKAVFKKEERLNRSFNGNYLKPPISPRRRKAVQVVIESMADRFEIKDALVKNANDCIVNGLRNESRTRFVLSELTPRVNI